MVKTWDTLQAEAVQSMGKDFGLLFINLRAQLHDIEWKWNEYVVLYGTKESRIKILNGTAPRFFAHLQDTLFADVVLHITRVTDSPKSVGKPNLTIRALPTYLNDNFRDEVEIALNEALSATEFCRDWRNKRIAHADLVHFTEEEPAALKEATREKVATAIDKIREVLSKISQKYLDGSVHPVSSVVIGGAEDLLFKLDDAIRSEVARQARFEAGQILPSDIERRDI